MRYSGRREQRCIARPRNSWRRACICRTRVPAKSLFDHLEAGDSIEDFLEGFPSVKREQVIALLEDSKAHVLAAR